MVSALYNRIFPHSGWFIFHSAGSTGARHIIKRGMSQNSCISDAIILWHPSFLQQAFTVIWAPAVNKEKKCCSKYNSGQLLYWGNATRFLWKKVFIKSSLLFTFIIVPKFCDQIQSNFWTKCVFFDNFLTMYIFTARYYSLRVMS